MLTEEAEAAASQRLASPSTLRPQRVDCGRRDHLLAPEGGPSLGGRRVALVLAGLAMKGVNAPVAAVIAQYQISWSMA